MFTTELRNNVLNHVFRGEEYQAPSQIFVALHTASGEVSAAEYSRQLIEFSPATSGRIQTSEEVRFDTATSDWGEVVELVIYDAETGGTALDTTDITPKEVAENEQVFIPQGGYEIEVVACD